MNWQINILKDNLEELHFAFAEQRSLASGQLEAGARGRPSPVRCRSCRTGPGILGHASAVGDQTECAQAGYYSSLTVLWTQRMLSS